MTNDLWRITLAQARQMAEDAVMREKDQYENPDVQKALEDEFLEAENCWIFLRNRKINVLPERWFTKSYGAFAISKRGTFSQITAFEENQAQLLAYLQTMSEYFGRRGE